MKTRLSVIVLDEANSRATLGLDAFETVVSWLVNARVPS